MREEIRSKIQDALQKDFMFVEYRGKNRKKTKETENTLLGEGKARVYM